MSLRGFLRQWLRGLRPTTATPAVSAYSHLRRLHSLEALMLLPTVTPDRSEYERLLADADTVSEVAMWLFLDWSEGRTEDGYAAIKDTALCWLALREIVMGVRLP